MKKFYTAASTLLLTLSMAMTTSCSSDSDHVINQQPVVPEQPAEDTRTITLKALTTLGDETRISTEGVEGKEDAFRITGWKNGDLVKVMTYWCLQSDYWTETLFTYNKGTNEFTGQLDKHFKLEDLKYAYVGSSANGHNASNLSDPNFSLQIHIEVPIGFKNPEDCFLFGNVKIDGESSISAELSAPYALACFHNNTNSAIEVGQVTQNGQFLTKKLCYTLLVNEDTRKEGSFEFKSTLSDDASKALKITVPAGSKAYFVIPPKSADGTMYGLYDFTNDITIAAPKENVTPGKVYKVKYDRVPAASWRYALDLGKTTATSIVIETDVNVSLYTSDETHKILNDQKTLWQVLDGLVLRIQTSEAKAIAPTEATNLFADYTKVTSITGLNNLEMNHTVWLTNMFSNCENLEELDLSSFNTQKVTRTNHMFEGCKKLRSLTFGENFSMKLVVRKNDMFTGCGTEEGKCHVYGVSDSDLRNALQDGTGWNDSHMEFDW